MKMYHQQQNQRLIIQKVDNTIKIENIYASQIVEEIRRERERKVLQKRRFKKRCNKSVKNIKRRARCNTTCN